MKNNFIFWLCLCLFFSAQVVSAQSKKDVTVDANGVMRWPDQSEVHGFGVNYTMPFAHAYRMAKKLGVDPKKAIDDDVYHFARLDLDAYRVHVWDTEISDTLGNLLVNEHLDMFDYLLFKLKERGMNYVITPIAFWGNGWPEPNEDTPGFSAKYGIAVCLKEEVAIQAQENYLFQFLNHVNPLTGLAYKDDPSLVAFEISNEPHHDDTPENVTNYVTRLTNSMRKTGCQKPIFYNVSHSIHLADAYYQAPIQGGTFQWYPTGLGSGEELGGNLLPNVDHYDIPFKNIVGFKKGAKIIYEFDAADVAKSYIYPAIARSFRTAGFQWATQFAYDPTFMAYANTEYNTHFMNLVYAPQKALSLKIASAVFHQVPLYKDYGSFPKNTTFDAFKVNYEQNLAELNTAEKFYYTNSTSSLPINPKSLKEIAGFGNSSVVKYEGQGAYFLDQLEKGVWRLEVMPDAIWTKNMFGQNSLDKTNAVIIYRQWPMSIALTDLGIDFAIKGLNKDNVYQATAGGQNFKIKPGTYLITKKGKSTAYVASDRFKNFQLGEYVAPKSTIEQTELLYQVPTQISVGEPLKVQVTVVSAETPQSVKLIEYKRWKPKIYELKNTTGFEYETVIPSEELSSGYFSYFIVVEEANQTLTFPQGTKDSPLDWDFHQNEPYTVSVIPVNVEIHLLDIRSDFDLLNFPWVEGIKRLPTADRSIDVLSIYLDKIPQDEASNIPDYSIRQYFGEKIKGQKEALSQKKFLVVKGRSMATQDLPIQVSLITTDGKCYGGLVFLEMSMAECLIELSQLKPVPLVTLPRPYPGFQPYFLAGEAYSDAMDLTKVETLQISIGPGLTSEQLKIIYHIEIEHVKLK